MREMSTAKKILEDALTLPNQTRADVAAALLASLEPDVSAAHRDTEDWLAEIERRAERVRSGQSVGQPWQSVRARLLARLHTD